MPPVISTAVHSCGSGLAARCSTRARHGQNHPGSSLLPRILFDCQVIVGTSYGDAVWQPCQPCTLVLRDSLAAGTTNASNDLRGRLRRLGCRYFFFLWT